MASSARPQFRFDPTAHAYYVGRRRLPSITQILRRTLPAGASYADWYTEASSARGRRIHAATARYDLGGGWGDDLLVGDVARVHAYAAFLDARRPRYDEIEQPRYSTRYQFAGTPDRVGRWADGRAFILDIKTGIVTPDCGLQTAAQAVLVDGDWRARLRYTLHLRDDATYRLVSWDNPEDWAAFAARLAQFQTEDFDGRPD